MATRNNKGRKQITGFELRSWKERTSPSLGTAEACQTPVGWDWRSRNQQGETELDYENMQASKISIDKSLACLHQVLIFHPSLLAQCIRSLPDISLLLHCWLISHWVLQSPSLLPSPSCPVTQHNSITAGVTLQAQFSSRSWKVLELLGHQTWSLTTTHLPSPTPNTIPLSHGIHLLMAGPGGWCLHRKNTDWASSLHVRVWAKGLSWGLKVLSAELVPVEV